ncbi:hypothetical protein MMC14_010438 [Varicellaria rhodocarpa]|nr:hypothetical protein [Varicellaria rhodocarpa]
MHLSPYILMLPYLAGVALTASDSPNDNTITTGESDTSSPDPLIHAAAVLGMKPAKAPAQPESDAPVVEVREEAEPRQLPDEYTAAPEPTTFAKRTATKKHHAHTKHSHLHTYTGTHKKHKTGHKMHKHKKTRSVEPSSTATTTS